MDRWRGTGDGRAFPSPRRPRHPGAPAGRVADRPGVPPGSDPAGPRGGDLGPPRAADRIAGHPVTGIHREGPGWWRTRGRGAYLAFILAYLCLAYIRACADYAAAGWMPDMAPANLEHLEVAQRQACRIITGCLRSTLWRPSSERRT